MAADADLRLGRWFGTSQQVWLDLQKFQDLRLAQREAGDAVKRPATRTDGAQAG